MSHFDDLQSSLEGQGYKVTRIKPDQKTVSASSKSDAMRAAYALRKAVKNHPTKFKQTMLIAVLGAAGILERMKGNRLLRGDIKLAFTAFLAFCTRFPSIWSVLKNIFATWGITKLFKRSKQEEEDLIPESEPDPEELKNMGMGSFFHHDGDSLEGLPDTDLSAEKLEKLKVGAKNRIIRNIKVGLKKDRDFKIAMDTLFAQGSSQTIGDAKKLLSMMSTVTSKPRPYLKGVNLVYFIGIYEAIKQEVKKQRDAEDSDAIVLEGHIKADIHYVLASLKKSPGDEDFHHVLDLIKTFC